MDKEMNTLVICNSVSSNTKMIPLPTYPTNLYFDIHGLITIYHLLLYKLYTKIDCRRCFIILSNYFY